MKRITKEQNYKRAAGEKYTGSSFVCSVKIVDYAKTSENLFVKNIIDVLLCI